MTDKPTDASSDDAASDDAATADEASQEAPAPAEASPDPDKPAASTSASMDEEDAATVEPEPLVPVPPAQAKAKARGGVLGVIAFLFAMLGLGGVGYLYYVLIYLDPLRQLEQENVDVRTQTGAIRAEFTEQMTALRTATEQTARQTRDEVARTVADAESAVRKSLQEALTQAPPSTREWQLAEAEYLLRIANHRVLMEDDSIGALNLLRSADAIMAGIDDFAYHQVRARLADEIVALQQVRRDDLQGLYLRLEAVKLQIAKLPIVTPEYLQAKTEDATDRTVWEILVAEMKDLVRIRTTAADESIKPLLAPEEERYLELNLRLSLEQAQLAVLKRHQAVYEHSLSRARDWIEAYLEKDDERTEAMLASLDELLLVDLARPLPDISGSLNELVKARGAVQ